VSSTPEDMKRRIMRDNIDQDTSLGTDLSVNKGMAVQAPRLNGTPNVDITEALRRDNHTRHPLSQRWTQKVPSR